MKRWRTQKKEKGNIYNISSYESILLAILPFASFVYAYIYEYFYADAIHIPTELISISIVNIISAFGIILMFIMIFSILAYISISDNIYIKHFSKAISLILLNALMWIIVYTIHDDHKIYARHIMYVTIITIVLICSHNIIILGILLRDRGNIGQRIEFLYELKNSESKNENTIRKWLNDKRILTFASLLSIAFFSASIAGGYAATAKIRYLTINTSPKLVVLRIYNNNMICAPLNPKTKKVDTSRISIYNINEIKNRMTFREERLGNIFEEYHIRAKHMMKIR